jgi:hypothetical protein
MRPSTAPERISLGMEVIAVAVGVGYGVVDSITRRARRPEPSLPPDLPVIDLRDTTRATDRPRTVRGGV